MWSDRQHVFRWTGGRKEQLNSCCISGDKARNKWMKVVTWQETALQECHFRGVLIGFGDRWEAWKLGWQRIEIPVPQEEGQRIGSIFRAGRRCADFNSQHAGWWGLVELGGEMTRGWLEMWGWHFSEVKILRYDSSYLEITAEPGTEKLKDV